jgi:hypothetical protein
MGVKASPESDWQAVADLHIYSKAVAIVDPMSWDSMKVALEPGDYFVRIKAIRYSDEDSPRVTRVQVAGASDGSLGKVLGEVAVDAATIGILDAKALDPKVADETAAHQKELESSWQSGDVFGTVKWGDGDDDVMVHVSTGFGDGEFAVRAVVKGGRTIGFEIEFIDPSQPRPF